MKKNYNSARSRLYLPEYGRHIQEMVNSLKDIANRDQRNQQARAVIAVMGNLNTTLRDSADFTHKLWDHLFIMADFQLDVDSPYPTVSRESLTIRPRKMGYSTNHIVFKHYGKNVERLIHELEQEQDAELRMDGIVNLVRYMRAKSYEYNEEHPNNEVIIKDIKRMSRGAIELDEVVLNSIQSEYKQNVSARSHGGGKQQNNKRQHKSSGGKQQKQNNQQRQQRKK